MSNYDTHMLYNHIHASEHLPTSCSRIPFPVSCVCLLCYLCMFPCLCARGLSVCLCVCVCFYCNVCVAVFCCLCSHVVVLQWAVLAFCCCCARLLSIPLLMSCIKHGLLVPLCAATMIHDGGKSCRMEFLNCWLLCIVLMIFKCWES